jgi:hypothetical protein
MPGEHHRATLTNLVSFVSLDRHRVFTSSVVWVPIVSLVATIPSAARSRMPDTTVPPPVVSRRND